MRQSQYKVNGGSYYRDDGSLIAVRHYVAIVLIVNCHSLFDCFPMIGVLSPMSDTSIVITVFLLYSLDAVDIELMVFVVSTNWKQYRCRHHHTYNCSSYDQHSHTIDRFIIHVAINRSLLRMILLDIAFRLCACQPTLPYLARCLRSNHDGRSLHRLRLHSR